MEAAPAEAAFSGPPERLFGLESDVALGEADVMKVAVGPLREFLTGAVALPPGMEGLADLGQNTPNMMICHRFVGQSGHFQLLKLSLEANICASGAIHKRHFVPFRMK
jgi:hypothetical protein